MPSRLHATNRRSSLRVIVSTIQSELAAPEFSLVSNIHRQRCATLAPVLREGEVLTALIAACPQNNAGEYVVRPGGEWKRILAESGAAQNAAATVTSMRDEIDTLWADAAVQELLEKKCISLRDEGG